MGHSGTDHPGTGRGSCRRTGSDPWLMPQIRPDHATRPTNADMDQAHVTTGPRHGVGSDSWRETRPCCGSHHGIGSRQGSDHTRDRITPWIGPPQGSDHPRDWITPWIGSHQGSDHVTDQITPGIGLHHGLDHSLVWMVPGEQPGQWEEAPKHLHRGGGRGGDVHDGAAGEGDGVEGGGDEDDGGAGGCGE